MTYERDYKKIILYLFGCFGLAIGTLFIAFTFLLDQVNAATGTFSAPHFVINNADGSATDLGNGVAAAWWGSNNWWSSKDQLYQFQQIPLPRQWYLTNNNFNMCPNSSYITIEGEIAMLPDPGVAMFSNSSYFHFDAVLGGKDMSCSVSPGRDGWSLNFQCTGVNGKGLLIGNFINHYRDGNKYWFGIRKTFNYTCDSGPSEIIVNQNNNTNQIIQNNNNNTNQIIENNNRWSGLIHDSLDQTKQFIADATVRHDIADGVLGADYKDTYGLNDIINLPLNLLNHLTDSCNTISLTIPYIDEDVTIQCPSYYYGKILSNSAITLISTIINAFVIYRFLMVIVNSVNKAKNPDDDKLEMIEL